MIRPIFIPCPNGNSSGLSGFIVENGGYHFKANIPYIIGGTWSSKSPPSAFTIDAVEYIYAMVVSHEIAEAIVDPIADSQTRKCVILAISIAPISPETTSMQWITTWDLMPTYLLAVPLTIIISAR